MLAGSPLSGFRGRAAIVKIGVAPAAAASPASGDATLRPCLGDGGTTRFEKEAIKFRSLGRLRRARPS